MNKIIIFLFINIFISKCKEIKYSHSNTENNLYFVLTTFRHGARYPYFKIDVFNNEISEPGELTSYGVRQHLDLGKKLRKRYYNFLNLKEKKFDKEQLYVRSSAIIRTKISTLKQLEGLLNTNKVDDTYIDIITIKKSIMYLYSFNNTQTKEILDNFSSCNLRKLDSNEDFKMKLHQDLIPIFKQCYGNLGYIQKKQDFCDSAISAFYEYKYNNKKRNKIGKCGTKTARIFYEFCVDFYDSLKDWNEKRAYLMFSFFENIFKFMQDAIDKTNKLKMIMIGGHDNTLSELLNFFDGMNIINRTEYPHFAYNIIFELRKYEEEFYLEIYYNDILKYNKSLINFKDTLYHSKYSNLSNYCQFPNTGINNNTNNIIDLSTTDKNNSNKFNSNKDLFKEKIIIYQKMIKISGNIIFTLIIIKLLYFIYEHYRKRKKKYTFINKRTLFDTNNQFYI